MAIDITGISNENEFYTHHYLAAILENDLKSLFQEWKRREEEEAIPQPFTRLRGLRKEYFAMRSSLERERNIAERLTLQRRFVMEFLQVLGYELHSHLVDTDEGAMLPLLGGISRADGSPELWILEAVELQGEDIDPFTLTLVNEQYPDETEPKQRLTVPFEEIITKQVFSRSEPPRWVILVSSSQLLLLDRSKWHEKRLLRFDIREILDRRETSTLQATAALLHRESICPGEGTPLLDTLDENSHKHAFAVSEDLKYSLREAIELLGNEAVYYLREVRKEKIYGRDMAGQLTRECLRYMYRLLFLFYIEARPELGYLPTNSEQYRKGYSLESLRDLEMIPLTTEESKNGTYLHESISILFDLLYNGFEEKQLDMFGGSIHNTFQMPPLRSHLFDPAETPLLNKVKFRNFVLQAVIELMSLSQQQSGRNSRRGRISYSQLGINQLGAVYEALLSYQGFFAESDLYEVKRAQDAHSVLVTAYFVNAEELEKYTEEERVYRVDGTLMKYERGTFIYRLAGRDREKSASYYTPEVLTQCLVKYALKELLKDKTADEILELTVCEPAMGSAAFLNEAVNQLARAYLDLKQKEIGVTLSHEEYPPELQKVKMYIADNNVYGVDLNPTAVELAEVSLWLNTIYKGAFVPWFGTQLVCGNSLIGARRQVFSSLLLRQRQRGDTLWLDTAPERVMPGAHRQKNTVYHFLLPDKGMANYTDKVVKGLAGDQIVQINEWCKEFIKPFSQVEIDQLEQLSVAVDKLWQRHTEMQQDIDRRTTDPLRVFGQEQAEDAPQATTTEAKDRIYRQEMLAREVRNSSPYRRLKLVMDYWCALWFWPIEQADLLPGRAEYLFDLTLLLEGNLFEAEQTDSGGQTRMFPDTKPQQMSIEMVDEFGYVNVDKLCRDNRRLGLVQDLAERYYFHHWELHFASVFATRGGFDLVVGNPPWARVRLEAQKILSEFEPLIVVRNYNASKLSGIMPNIFNRQSNVKFEFLNESCFVAGVRNFISSGYYHLSGKSNNNLYKCFLEKSSIISNSCGVCAILHDPGIYDESSSSQLRNYLCKHLSRLFIFINQLNHFPEEALGHAGKFAISIFCVSKNKLRFDSISSVFHPKTIDESYSHYAKLDAVPKIKNENGWVLLGHKDRVIEYDDEVLALVNKGSGYNDHMSAPLLSVYTKSILSLLIKKSNIQTLKDVFPGLKGYPIIDETSGQKLNLIKKLIQRPVAIDQMIFSAPHYYVGTPIFKQPNEECRSKGDYNSVDLTIISETFLPRAVFNFSSSDALAEVLSAGNLNNFVKKYRFAWRNWVSSTNERTLITTIIPPNTIHVNTTFSMIFPDYEQLLLFAGLTFTLVYDFFIRVTGIDHVWNDDILNLPFPCDISDKIKNAIIERTLKLTCVTSYYRDLWNLLSDSEWSRSRLFLSHYERRTALVELDVLAAMLIGLSLKDLILLYTTQFPTFHENECNTWYDQKGRIVFTTNRSYSGVGLPRNASKTESNGWENVKDMESGRVEQTIIDDTQPCGPVERIIAYQAPFERCNREQDYETVWTEFERRFKE